MTQALLTDLWIVLAAGSLAGLVCHALHISVLVGYLLVGAMLGPGILGLVIDEQHQIEHFAEAGVFLLLFSIGLEFSLDDLRRLAKQMLFGGGVQMLLVAAPVALLLLGTQLAFPAAILMASAVAFSSTVLVFKGLSESGQSERPHGRRVIAILLFQDAALVPLLLMVPLLIQSDTPPGIYDYVRLGLISLAFVVAIILLRGLLARRLIPMFAKFRRPELVVLFTVVCLGGVTLTAYMVGLPAAVGAFAAGLIFNGNRWTPQIDSLVLPFRETFTAIFFVSLGLIFEPQLFIAEPLQLLGMLAAVILIKTVAGTVALRVTGLPWQQSAALGLGLAHIGEFAFVLVLLGWKAGVVSELDYRRLVSLAVGSLLLTPILLPLGLRWVNRWGGAESERAAIVPDLSETLRATVIGAGLVGRQAASQLELSGHDVCLIDFSPLNLHGFAVEGFRTIAGDATDANILKSAETDKSAMNIVSVSDDEVAARVVKAIRSMNQDGVLIVRCRYQANRERFKRLGADQVISEESVAATAMRNLLSATPRASHERD